MELATYTKQLTNKIKNLAHSYMKTEEELSTTQRCCMSISNNELSLACTNHYPNSDEILFLDKLKFDDKKSLTLILSGVAERHQLALTPIYWLLNPEDYQINLIESMPVPKNEFQTALNWRIRSLIDYPIDEAALESFELPAKKNSANTPLIAAVTARRTQLNEIVSLVKNASLHLVTIDIPELALLTLAALHENDEKTTAFLYFYERIVILNISCQKVLYFTRRIPIITSADSTIDYEKLSLEILRYFDFFRSQWRLASPTRIFAFSESGNTPIIAKAMTERLLNNVEAYTLPSTTLTQENKDKITTQYLLDYGCLLRKDSGNVTTRD